MITKISGLLALLLLVAPITGTAQPPGKVWRIAVLRVLDRPDPVDAAFSSGMNQLGYVEGRNLVLERRSSLGKSPGALDQTVQEVVQLNVDVIVAWAAPWALAAKRATRTVPIVFAGVRAPVERGLVPSLARPGANVTGISTYPVETLDPKLFELAKELFPSLSRVAVLRSTVDPPGALTRQENAARVLGLTITAIPFSDDRDVANAPIAIERSQAQLLIAPDTPLLYAQRKQIVEFAARRRLPVVYAFGAAVEDGGLVALGNDFKESARRAAVYVDKILKGTRPADLPVEQPTKIELSINLKTAKALDLTIPPLLLLRADQVIE